MFGKSKYISQVVEVVKIILIDNFPKKKYSSKINTRKIITFLKMIKHPYHFQL